MTRYTKLVTVQLTWEDESDDCEYDDDGNHSDYCENWHPVYGETAFIRFTDEDGEDFYDGLKIVQESPTREVYTGE